MQHLRRGQRLIRADLLGGLQREPTEEHRQTPEQHPLLFVEGLVAPRDRRVQALLARPPRPRPTAQQPQAVSEAVGDLLHRKQSHPRRGQLERQRNPVHSATDPDHRRRVLGRLAEACPDLDGALDEQPGCVGGHRILAPPIRVSGERQLDGTLQSVSPSTPNGCLLVASTRNRGQPRNSASTSRPTGSSTCSRSRTPAAPPCRTGTTPQRQSRSGQAVAAPSAPPPASSRPARDPAAARAPPTTPRRRDHRARPRRAEAPAESCRRHRHR